MALTPVNRHLGLFGLLMPMLGCADDVELLSSNERSGPGFDESFASGGGPSRADGGAGTVTGLAGQGAIANGAGGTVGQGGSPSSASGGTGAAGGSGLDLPTCEHGWSARAFSRNGSTQFACAPPSACHSSGDCGTTEICYGGATCDEGCAEGDPLCCEGNFCASPGCDGAVVPLSCTARGCALGERCVGPDWTPPDCDCAGSVWVCRTAAASSQCQ